MITPPGDGAGNWDRAPIDLGVRNERRSRIATTIDASEASYWLLGRECEVRGHEVVDPAEARVYLVRRRVGDAPVHEPGEGDDRRQVGNR